MESFCPQFSHSLCSLSPFPVQAEVQQVMSEGSVALHTRSTKYGKLAAGQLLEVPASLIKRQKQHFVSIPAIGERWGCGA